MTGEEAFRRVTSALTVWALREPGEAAKLPHRSLLSMLALIRNELKERANAGRPPREPREPRP